MQPAVDVIVVNFNAGEALLRCIRSVLAQDVPVGLTVVDNASTDGSAERAAAEFGRRPGFSLLRSPDNPGFATAVNRAVPLPPLPQPEHRLSSHRLSSHPRLRTQACRQGLRPPRPPTTC